MASDRVHYDTSSSDREVDAALAPASASLLQTVNIRNHAPVNLDLNASNYSHWRCFFDSVLGKLGITNHVTTAPPITQRDAEWRMIVNWIHNTITKNVFDIIQAPLLCFHHLEQC
jgi:hypothetical protein